MALGSIPCGRDTAQTGCQELALSTRTLTEGYQTNKNKAPNAAGLWWCTDAMVAVCQTRAHEEFGWWNGAGWRPGDGWVVWTVKEWVWILGR